MSERIPTILAGVVFAFVVAATQIDLMPEISWHDQQRVAQVVLLVLVLGLSLPQLLAGKDFPSLLSRGAWLGLVAIACLGALSASNAALPRWAWIEWALLLSLVLGALAIARIRRAAPETFDHGMLWVLVATCSLLLLRMLATHAGNLLAGGPVDTRELSALGFSNRRFFGQVLTLLIPFLAVLLLGTTRRLAMPVAVLLSGCWMMAFVSATRGTFFALGVALPFLAIWCGNAGRQLFKWQLRTLVAGFAAYLALILALPLLLGIEVDAENRLGALFDSSGRLKVWAYTAGLILENPGLGIGPMHFAYFRPPAMGHPHNSVLQLAVEWGLPATAIAVFLFCMALAKMGPRIRSPATPSPLVVAIAGSLFAGGLQSLVDGVIVMPVSQVFLMLVAGWAIGVHGNVQPMRRRAHAIASILFGALLLILASSTFRDIDHLERRQDNYREQQGKSYFHPRFWQHGWIGEPPVRK